MNAGLLILRVASERRDAQNERDREGLRSSVATPSQQHYNLALNWSSSSRPSSRGDASCAQHQLRRSNKQATAVSRDHERSTGRKTSLSNPSNIIAQPLKLFATFLPP